ncbi:hypothetical protein MYX84_01055 [Acidobacteria bacterium AH-259-O06]|nr:hypothetical protein [Acidobacteria bacterium AH-259-O06]
MHLRKGQKKDLSSLIALKESLAEIQHQLSQIESLLGTSASEIKAKLKALDTLLQADEGAVASTPDTLSIAPGLELSRIKTVFQKLSTSQSQDQILQTYLEEAQSLASRGVLFLKKDDQYVPWKAIGFQLEQVESVGTQDQENPILKAALRKRIVVPRTDLDPIFAWLKQAGELPRAALCIPFVFDDFVPVVLYVDSSDSIPLDSLELLSHLTVLVLKNQYLQQLTGSEPSGQEVVSTDLAPSGEPLPASAQERQPEKTTAIRERTELPESVEFIQFRADSASSLQQESERSEKERPPSRLVLEQTKPQVEVPSQPQSSFSSEEDKYHAEARRLSRLLVSEIKLHNGQEINQGRQHKDLYSRLKEDIDGGWEKYREQVHPAVASKRDYYHEEVARILAMGDERLMGSDYPGAILNPKP